jgi:hypothetical protein
LRSRQIAGSPAALIALGLAAAVAYAAFASGAIALPAEARLQLGIAALSLLSFSALLFARGMRVSASNAGCAGLALMAALTAWTGASIAWSIAPDLTWASLNRTLAYTLITAIAMTIGASLPRAAERTAKGFLAIAAVVALYALGGKALPTVFHHADFFSRLRAPLSYWNALSLFFLLTTIGLTYSRGGVAALLVAVVVVLIAGPDRLRTAAVAAAGVIGAAPALAIGFTSNDLTGDAIPVASRTDDGLLFAAALVAGAIAAIFIERLLEQRADRVVPTAIQRRRALAVAGIGAVVAIALAAGGLAASDRGLTGSVEHGFDTFTSVKFERQNDPARILQTNSGNRWVWWSEAVGAWADRPLEGWGAGSFPLLHHRYRHNGLEVLQPHSVPLQFLAETGVAGALIALAALALLTLAGARRVAAGLRSARAGIPPGRQHRYAVALLAAVAAWLVHMWFDWDWDIPGVALPLFAFLGVLAARPLGTPGHSVTPPRSGNIVGRRLGALVLGTALACAVAVSAALPSLARDQTQAATEAFAKRDYAEAVRRADIAQRLNPVAVDGLLLEARAAGRRGQFALASSVLTDAVHRQPGNPGVWLGVARLELARGDVPAMRAAARHMLELDPVAPIGRFFFLSNDLGVRSATATGTPLTP